MLAWGQDHNHPGHTTNAYTAEGALATDAGHTVFARVELVHKDELFVAPDPLAGRVFPVGEVTAGYRFDLVRSRHSAIGLGVAGTLSRIPSELVSAYGAHPAGVLVFVRAAAR